MSKGCYCTMIVQQLEARDVAVECRLKMSKGVDILEMSVRLYCRERERQKQNQESVLRRESCVVAEAAESK